MTAQTGYGVARTQDADTTDDTVSAEAHGHAVGGYGDSLSSAALTVTVSDVDDDTDWGDGVDGDADGDGGVGGRAHGDLHGGAEHRPRAWTGWSDGDGDADERRHPRCRRSVSPSSADVHDRQTGMHRPDGDGDAGWTTRWTTLTRPRPLTHAVPRGIGLWLECPVRCTVTVTRRPMTTRAGADAVADGRWRWTEGASGSYTVALNDGPRPWTRWSDGGDQRRHGRRIPMSPSLDLRAA